MRNNFWASLASHLVKADWPQLIDAVPIIGQLPRVAIGAAPFPSQPLEKTKLKCAYFFCGIGGFHVAARNLGLDVVFACDIDPRVRRGYQHYLVSS